MKKNIMGVHIIVDLFGCPRKKTEKREEVGRICLEVIQEADLSMLNANFHQFEPSGVTGLVLLEESHLSVHTWPEHNSVSADVFCCILHQERFEEIKKKAEKACDLLVKKFRAKRIKKAVVVR